MEQGQCMGVPLCPSVHLIYLPTYLLTYLPTYLHTCLCIVAHVSSISTWETYTTVTKFSEPQIRTSFFNNRSIFFKNNGTGYLKPRLAEKTQDIFFATRAPWVEKLGLRRGRPWSPVREKLRQPVPEVTPLATLSSRLNLEMGTAKNKK